MAAAPSPATGKAGGRRVRRAKAGSLPLYVFHIQPSSFATGLASCKAQNEGRTGVVHWGGAFGLRAGVSAFPMSTELCDRALELAICASRHSLQ